MNVNVRKVAIIGCGFVGSTCAYTLMQHGLFSEMVLLDADRARAEGEAMDISHGLLFAKPMNIYAGDYDDLKDAAVVIITAGANQKPGKRGWISCAKTRRFSVRSSPNSTHAGLRAFCSS